MGELILYFKSFSKLLNLKLINCFQEVRDMYRDHRPFL